MNALNMQVVAELTEAVSDLEKNTKVQCVILTGESNYFVAGADVREMNGMSVHQAYDFAQEMKALHDAIVNSRKPYIAAISGYCLGGGLELALACDIRIVNKNAIIGFPEVNLGIIPGGGGIHRLKELTGISIASQLIMTGELIDATKAKELQIANEVFEDVLPNALNLARKIVNKSNFAITAIKKLLNKRALRESASILDEEIHEFSKLFDYADAYEGMSAFIEKRQPVFEKGEVRQK